MAKKKKTSKQGIFSKLVNVGFLALGMSRVLEIVFNNITAPADIPKIIIREATFGLSEGAFSMARGARFYGPPVASILTKMVFNFVRKRNPVR